MLNRKGIQREDRPPPEGIGTEKKIAAARCRKKVENEGLNPYRSFFAAGVVTSSGLTTLNRIWYFCRDSFIRSNSNYITGATIYRQPRVASGMLFTSAIFVIFPCSRMPPPEWTYRNGWKQDR